jgi:hypothetical protein
VRVKDWVGEVVRCPGEVTKRAAASLNVHRERVQRRVAALRPEAAEDRGDVILCRRLVERESNGGVINLAKVDARRLKKGKESYYS